MLIPISKGKFCDYCGCERCQNGPNPKDMIYESIEFYSCENGFNICSSCWLDEPCDGQDFFCDKFPLCKHKPKVIYE